MRKVSLDPAMFEGPVIIWAASRVASTAEKKTIAQVARDAGAGTRTIAPSALAGEILSSLVQGPVVAIVDSRKDAATVLRLGADETVRVGRSVPLQKGRLRAAIGRAVNRSRARSRPADGPRTAGEYPGLAFLMQVVERRLGSPLNQAAVKCGELANELTRAVAVADGLMQRVRLGSRDDLKGWSKEVKDYARATLNAENLVSKLREQVEHGDAVIKLLGDLSIDSSDGRTEVGSLLEQLAVFLRNDLGASVAVEVTTTDRCLVEMGRAALLCIVCGAVESALENVHAANVSGRIELRASRSDGNVLVEVADNGVPVATDLRTSIVDSLLADPRTAKLRQLRKRVRGAGGELTVDADEGGTLVSIYLPTCAEETAAEPFTRTWTARAEKRDH